MNPVSNLTTSFLLLAIGLTILWLAATNRLSNFLTAWQALEADPGKAQSMLNQMGGVSAPGQTGSTSGGGGGFLSGVSLGPGGVTIPGVGTIDLGGLGSSGGLGGTPPYADPGTPALATSAQLEVGGGTTYKLAQLPSIGTINAH